MQSERSQLKATTFHSYESNIRLHVLPTLGGGPGVSPSSVRCVHRILRKALNDAVRKGTLTRNPASPVDLPKRSARTNRGREKKV